MTQLLIPFVALVVAGTGLAQQSRVIPPGLADIEGNLSSTSPFGRTTAGMQFLCDPNVVATAPGFVIDIGLRDEGDQNTYQSYTKQYKLTAAQTSVLAAAMTTDPVVNHGGSTPVVVFQALLNVPGSVPQAVLPKPFALRLPFNAPFNYDPALGGLVLTLTTDDALPAAGTHRLDAASLRNDRPDGIVHSAQPGCAAAGSQLTLAADATQLFFGGNLAATMTSTTPGAFPLAAFLLGFTRQNLDLSPLGMAGCSLGVDIAATITVQENLGAYPPITLAIPSDPNLEDVAMFAQGFGVTASPGTLVGSVTSNLLGLHIGNPAGHSIWSQSIFSTNLTSWFVGRTGTFMPVLELRGILP